MVGGLLSGLAICWLTGELRLRAQLDRCCSLSYSLSADTSNGMLPNRHENGISLSFFRGDEAWSKLRILLRQVEHAVEFFAAGTGSELFELCAGMMVQIRLLEVDRIFLLIRGWCGGYELQ